MLNAPANFTYYKDTTDFFWSSNNANTGRMDLIVYTFPYTDPNTFTEEYLVAKRDSVLKANLPGRSRVPICKQKRVREWSIRQ